MSGRVTGFIGRMIERLRTAYTHWRYRPTTLTIVIAAADAWELVSVAQEQIGIIEPIDQTFYVLRGIRHMTPPVYDDRYQVYLACVTYDIANKKTAPSDAHMR